MTRPRSNVKDALRRSGSVPNAARVAEIKAAVRAGKFVFWQTPIYRVIEDSKGQWLIVCEANGYAIGLTWADGETLNGKAEDFHICDARPL